MIRSPCHLASTKQEVQKRKVGTIGEVAIRSEVCHLLQSVVVLGTFAGSLFNSLV